jgi:hypothetical protein
MVNIRTIGNLERMQLSKTNTDLDSHANQSVLGCNILYDFVKLVNDFVKLVNIIGYDPNGPIEMELCTITGALAGL